MTQNWNVPIKHIALCGHPKSGKSTFADMMAEEYGGVVIDDGLILRKAVPILFGIPEEECFTQEGKAKVYNICGKEVSVRQMLGYLGNHLEGMYSEHFMPVRAMQIANELYPEAPFYLYPSCRKTQGHAYKERGGIVIKIDNPRVEVSENAFDAWDESAVDFTLLNDPENTNLDMMRNVVRMLGLSFTAQYNGIHL